MRESSRILISSGFIPTNILQLCVKWGLPVEVPEDLIECRQPSMDADMVARLLATARDDFSIGTTDVDLLHRYVKTQKTGSLMTSEDGVEYAEVEIIYGRTHFGEYILPWADEEAQAALQNGFTYLLADDEQVFFHAVGEFYYGPDKTFLVCTPTRKRHG